MCGFTGFYEIGAYKKKKLLTKMMNTLRHRGPDEDGAYIKNNVAFGHKRLIVVDPEGGKQPMIEKVGGKDIVLIYNGELYNTDEVRGKLMKLGYQFASHSDTEVLLKSYIAWREKCLDELNGIFAFAVYDEGDNSIFLARDRFGVKPLFYHFSNDLFLFGSEIKALLVHDKISTNVDEEGLLEVLSIGPARTQGCGIFKDIKEVRPGHFLLFKDNTLKDSKYYEIPYYAHIEDLSDTAHHLRELVISAVQRQLVSDVPLGTFLSGGIDSSIITAIAQKKYEVEGRALDTFSIDFAENEKYFSRSVFQPESDKEYVLKMLQAFKVNHHNIILKNTDTAYTLPDALRYRDLPGMADIDSSLYLSCREVKEHVTVALSGECADEIFGGYPWFYRPELKSPGLFPWTRDMEFRQSMLNDKYNKKLNLAAHARMRYKEALETAPPYYGEDMAEKETRDMFYLNILYFMSNLLERKDRMSMGCGLEVRVPFCDHLLFEYVFNIPWAIKYYNQREKGILRLAMEGILPEEILWRKKSPYPKTYHPDYENLVYGMLKEEINKKNLFSEIFDVKNVMELTHAKSTRPWFGQLMSGPQLAAYLVQFSKWLDYYNINLVE